MTPPTRDEMETLRQSMRSETEALHTESEALRNEVSALRKRVELVEALKPVVTNHGGRLEMLETELAGLKQELGMVHSVVDELMVASKTQAVTIDRLLSASTTQGLTMERVEKLLVHLVAHVKGAP